MKFWKKCIIGLFLILATSAVLFKLYPTKEVKAYSGNWGLVTIGTKLSTSVTIDGVGSNVNVWMFYVDGKIAFCANPRLYTNQSYYFPRTNVSSWTAANQAVTWYTNTGYNASSTVYQHLNYTIAQVVVWGIIDGKITDAYSATTMNYVNNAINSMSYFQVNNVPNQSSYIQSILYNISNTSAGTVYYYNPGSSLQPLLTTAPGTYYYEPDIKSVSETASANVSVKLDVIKTDAITGKTLEGVVFDIYSGDTLLAKDLKTDANGKISYTYTTNVSGSGSAQYISNLDKVLPSERDQYSSMYTTESAARSAAKTKAEADAKAKVNVKRTFKVVEKSTNTGYYFNSTTGTIVKDITGSGTVTFEVKNNYQTGKITILKKDESTNAPLSGVVYGLYASEDIVHPDGQTGVLYKKDKLVKEFPATNSEGKSTLSGLYLGKYYIQEITPPAGYKLDKTKHQMELASTNSTTAVVTKEIELMDGVSSVTVYKIGADTKKGLEGVKFELYAKEAILKSDKSVVFEKDQLVEAFPDTDSEGKTTLYQLLPGEYYIKEISTLDGYVKLTKTIGFTLDELGVITTDDKYVDEDKYGDAIVIKNELTKITISKQDMATSKELPGATISICQTYLDENGNIQILVDENTGDCIEAILKDGTKATWVSTNKPHEIEGLSVGTYYLVEKIAPKDYSTAESILFTLNEDGTLVDKAGNSLKDNKLVMKDAPLVNKATGSTSTYVVIGIIAVVAVLGVGSYYYMKKNNKNSK